MRWRIGNTIFETLTREIHKQGDDPVKLGGPEANVLEVLIKYFDKKCNDEQIRKEAWEGGRSVNRLSKSIEKLRDAFGGERKSVISTLPYRLVLKPYPLESHEELCVPTEAETAFRTNPIPPKIAPIVERGIDHTLVQDQQTLEPAKVFHTSSIRFLTKWKEADRIIANAKHSVVIIDSFFSQYGNLDDLIGEAVRNGAENLELSVYMTSPNKAFGAQRIKEKRRFMNNYPQLKLALESKALHSEFEEYIGKFHDFDDEIKNLERPSVGVKVYEYPTMPSIRFIVVDEIHMFVGWYPLFAQNPDFVCIYMQKTHLKGTDVEVFEKLKAQYEHIRNISVRARPKEKRENWS